MHEQEAAPEAGRAPDRSTSRGPVRRDSMKNAYFAYRLDPEGFYSVAFHSGKRYAYGPAGKENLAARCEAAATSHPENTYAVVNLETYEIADLFGALLGDQMSALCDEDPVYTRTRTTPEKSLENPGPPEGLMYGVAYRSYRSLLDVAEGVFEVEHATTRFPTSPAFKAKLRERIQAFNDQKAEHGSLTRAVLTIGPKDGFTTSMYPVDPF